MRDLKWFAALLLLAAAALFAYGQEQRRRGAAEAQGARWKAELDSLAAVVRRVDTVYRVQRDTFYARSVRLDTLILSVDRWKSDTVRVVEFVARADSTVRACTLALQSCDAREALRIQQLRAWERRWETREKPRSAFWVWTERGLIAWGSYELGRRAR